MSTHVLVIEDEAPIRRMLVSTLVQAGYSTDQAGTGEEALLALAAHPPDVILLDLGLPTITGWEFLARLRSVPGGGELPVLVLSGVPRRGWDGAQVTGVLAYLPKPFRLCDVLHEVQVLSDFAHTRPHGFTHPPT
jgi:two-component system KDP operon response regulator KdpE